MKIKHLNLMHPRYWLTWLSISLLYAVTRLPYKKQLTIGKTLGRTAFYVLKRFRQIGYVNLRLCFPEYSELERKQLLQKHFESLGMGLIESAMAWWTPYHKLAPLLEVKGLEHLYNAINQKKGVLILSGHFTSLDICGRLFSAIFPLSVVYREQKNQVIDMLLKRYRNSEQMQPIHRNAIRQIITALKKNCAIWYAADQDYGVKYSVFAPFFNVKTATITTPLRYVKQTGAAVVSLFYARLPGAKGYQIKILPGVENFSALDAAQAARCFNEKLEAAIRAHPEQYLWIHRRFKTRPPNQTSFYKH